MQVIVTGTMTKKGTRRWRRSTTTRKKGGEAYKEKEWDSDKSYTDSSPDGTPPISPSTRVSSSLMSATSVSWPRKAKGRRYTLGNPQIYYFR
jgi:hypothetical protein